MIFKKLFRFFLFFVAMLPQFVFADETPNNMEKIQHIIVIYLENHSFDNLYGHFPNAEGIKNAGRHALQVDLKGKPYDTLPAVMKDGVVDKRFPKKLANRPFDINAYIGSDEKTGDLVHRFYQHQMQINSGQMNRFAAVSNAGGLTMGYYDGKKLPLWQYAKRFTLADHFFQAAFGGSFLNHQWLVCACTPFYENAPESLKSVLNTKGELVKDGVLTPDGYAVNTMQPRQKPYDSKEDKSENRLPEQTQATIGDRLSEKNVSWAWFSGGWNDAVQGKPARSFQFHHQPFVYFRNYAEGTAARAEHLKDETDFLAGIEKGELPAVSFYKPIGDLNEHPGYADVLSGDKHISGLLQKIEHSQLWKDTVVIVTYDEFGGFWDHVPPYILDRWGAGNRVPAIIVSPFAKRNYVDHTIYDTTSILKFIEMRFGLSSLTERDRKATALFNALKL